MGNLPPSATVLLPSCLSSYRHPWGEDNNNNNSHQMKGKGNNNKSKTRRCRNCAADSERTLPLDWRDHPSIDHHDSVSNSDSRNNNGMFDFDTLVLNNYLDVERHCSKQRSRNRSSRRSNNTKIHSPSRIVLRASLISGRRLDRDRATTIIRTRTRTRSTRQRGQLWLWNTTIATRLTKRNAVETILYSAAHSCEELCIRGQSPTAPRRLYLEELEAVLKPLRRTLAHLELKMIDIQRHRQQPRNHNPTTTDNQHQYQQQQQSAENDDISKFVSLLQSMTQLDTVIVDCCRMDADVLPVFLQTLVSSSSLPHLTQVQFHFVDVSPSQEELITNAALQLLRQRPNSLETLSLHHYPPITTTTINNNSNNSNNNNAMDDFWQRVNQTTALHSLKCSLNKPLPKYVLANNHHSALHHFTVMIEAPTPSSSSSSNVGDTITRTLDIVQSVAQGLQHNTVLHSLTVHLPSNTTTTCIQQALQAFYNVLEYDNMTLQQFQLYRGLQQRILHDHDDHVQAIDFFCYVNARGRKQLLRGDCSSTTATNHQDWIRHIHRCRDDTHVVHYLLRTNPTLFLSSC